MQYSEKESREYPSLTQLALYSLVAGMLLGIAALLVFLAHDRLSEYDTGEAGRHQSSPADAFDGSIAINPPIAIPDVALMNAASQPTRLSDFHGRYTLLTFGFTHCPDVCPLTLNDFARIQSQLGELGKDAHFVFISVDGKRDTPAALHEYFAFRELDGITALTGPEDDARRFGSPFGLAFEVSEEAVPGGYNVNHSTGSFLLDREGRWIMRYHFGVPPSSIAADMRSLIAAES